MMDCEFCPYDDGQTFQRKLRHGEDYQPEYCYCEKVGGKHYACGYCDDVDFEFSFAKDKKVKPFKGRDRAQRREVKKLKDLKRRKIIALGGYNPHAGWIKTRYNRETSEYEVIGTHIEYPQNSNCQRDAKRFSNRLIRRSKYVPNGCQYQKYYPYDWAVF